MAITNEESVDPTVPGPPRTYYLELDQAALVLLMGAVQTEAEDCRRKQSGDGGEHDAWLEARAVRCDTLHELLAECPPVTQ